MTAEAPLLQLAIDGRKVENGSDSHPSRSMSQDSPQRESPNSRFLAGQVPSGDGGLAQARNSAVGSVITHGIVGLLLLYVATRAPEVFAPKPVTTLPEITWIATPGPGGGGGGGGNKTPDPPRKAELKGQEKISVPVAPTPKPTPKETPPPAQVTLPAVPTASAMQDLPGMIASAPSISVPSQGMGTGGGAGTGRGTGVGEGTGSGVGPGHGGGFGGGAYQPGVNGVSMPEVISEKKPEYTSAAMRAKVQGTVEVQAVVNPDGTVGEARIVRSLDDRFGLDEKAIEAVRQWRFRPGVKGGRPVPVLVLIELTFTLR
jgi:periplasmic protein TonB